MINEKQARIYELILKHNYPQILVSEEVKRIRKAEEEPYKIGVINKKNARVMCKIYLGNIPKQTGIYVRDFEYLSDNNYIYFKFTGIPDEFNKDHLWIYSTEKYNTEYIEYTRFEEMKDLEKKGIEINKKLVEENKKIAESNTELVAENKKIVESNSKLVDINQEFLNDSRKFRPRDIFTMLFVGLTALATVSYAIIALIQMVKG